METELARLRAALDIMPEEARAVFERARFEGQDYNQIAAALNIGVGEVERRLAAAMLHLLRSWDGDGS